MNNRAIYLAFLVLSGCSSVPVIDDAGIDGGADAAIEEDAGPLDAGSPDAGPTRERCDEEGEVCCADGMCGGGLPCIDGLCGVIGCGELGGPCCGTGYCNILSGAVCEDGMCVEPHCGSEGYECCSDAPACREDFVCYEGSCLRCGDVGESCCPGSVCNGDFYCQVFDPGSLGFCLAEAPPCGGEGEACCPEGDLCDPGFGCMFGSPGSIGGTCVTGPVCGADRHVCCDTDPGCGGGSLCVTEDDGVDRCQRCGDYEQPCCEGAVECGPGLTCSAERMCELPPPT